MVKSVSRETAQADMPLMSSDCIQAGGDAFSVNTVRTRSGYTAEDSSDGNKSESEDSDQGGYTSRGTTTLRIQNDADTVQDIADLGLSLIHI